MSKRTILRKGSTRKTAKQNRWIRLRCLCQLACDMAVSGGRGNSAPQQESAEQHQADGRQAIGPWTEDAPERAGGESYAEQRQRSPEPEGQHGKRARHRPSRVHRLEESAVDEAAGK